MVEEDVHGLCKLLTQALTSCAVSRGFWIATTHEVITQPSLSEMFIQLQFSSVGPEEFGSVVRGVNPKKSCCTFYWQTLFLWPPRPCLQSTWAWFHHSQIGNVIKGSFWVPAILENLRKWLRKTNCKTPLSFSVNIYPATVSILPLHSEAEQGVLLFWLKIHLGSEQHFISQRKKWNTQCRLF